MVIARGGAETLKLNIAQAPTQTFVTNRFRAVCPSTDSEFPKKRQT
jgi:hypothetical protein